MFCTRVYPHVCGAAIPPAPVLHTSHGLSPRVWGSQTKEGREHGKRRSIPTCVGQPLPQAQVGGGQKVYPHVCGAAMCPAPSTWTLRGLSPRVWGSHTAKIPVQAVVRSIPTCVGQPPHATCPAIPAAVYPHVCGAAFRRRYGRCSPPGLSPRVWGSPGQLAQPASLCGSIPTCVGQPLAVPSHDAMNTVYPHVCGAANNMMYSYKENKGLSPRVWGSPET